MTVYAHALLAVLAFSWVALNTANAADNDDPRIRAFETGLRPAIIVEGEPGVRWTLAERMNHYKVPGLSIAVLRDGKIAWAKGYGFRQAGAQEKVDTRTVFSAGSVSKIGAAVMTLRLVESGVLSLDENVNGYLKRWSVPDNEFTALQHVTLRHILSHTAGLTVHGFPDFLPGEPLPTLIETLEGRAPAKTPPVRVDFKPGSKFRYSGGGITVEQLAIEDVTGLTFPAAAKQYLFTPLAMTRSTYLNPLPEAHGNIAKAHNKNGKPGALPRGWETMPEMAASGLWTTPSDLAKIITALMASYKGDNDSFLSKDITREMMKPVAPGSYGLGPQISNKTILRFSHSGSNESYKSLMEGHLRTENGLIIMTNGAQGQRLISEIRRSVAAAEGWPLKKIVRLARVDLTKAELDRIAGDYEPGERVKKALRIKAIQVRNEQGKLFIHYGARDGETGTRLLPRNKYTFITQNGRALRFEFLPGKDGTVSHLVARVGDHTFIANKKK